MTSPLKNITIIGASGSVGRLILNGFIGSPQFNVTILTRSSSVARFPDEITVRQSNYTDADLTAAFAGQDAVISVVGMGGFIEQIKFIDAAISAGVKRFIPSEFSTNTLSPAVRQLLPIFEEKQHVLEYLKTKESSTFSWTSIWTAFLFDWALDNGFLGYDVKSKSVTIWDGGNTKFTLTNVDQMQRATLAVLERADKTANKNVYVASAETSQNEILRALEEASGARYMVTNTTTDEEVRAGKDGLIKGDFAGILKLVQATSFGNIPNLRANYVRDEDLSNKMLGLEFGSVKETAARVVASTY